MAKSPSQTHCCAAIGCQMVIAKKLLMCSAHWYALPKGLRLEILELYGFGGQRVRSSMKALQNYRVKVHEAVTFIKNKEASDGKAPESGA